MIAWDRVQELQQEIGDDAFEEIVELFLNEVEDALASLESCQTLDQLGDAIHFLKGSALNLGFTSMVDACVQAEYQLSGEGMDFKTDILEIYQKSKTDFLMQKDMMLVA